jgi:predicted enzyme related to lactoylglutathione lyase
MSDPNIHLSAVRVFVNGLMAARVFYEHALGLKVLHVMPSAGYIVLDGKPVQIVIEEVLATAPQEERDLVGRFTGLSFEVDNMREEFQRLTSMGVYFSGDPEHQPWGAWLATIQDPSGNEIQLVQYDEKT